MEIITKLKTFEPNVVALECDVTLVTSIPQTMIAAFRPKISMSMGAALERLKQHRHVDSAEIVGDGVLE